VTPEDKKPRGPGTSAKGKKKAEEKFARQAAALRSNLKRRHQQRRGQDGGEQIDGETERE
jgi:hypothetical protein